MTPNEPAKDFINPWEDFLQSYQEQHTQMMGSFLAGMESCLAMPVAASSAHIGDVLVKATQALAEDPSSFLKAQVELVEDLDALWEKMLSIETKVTSEQPADRRFRHQAWETVPYFLFIKEYYLITSHWLEKMVSEIEGLDEKTKHKVRFYIKQIVDAASPTNSPFTNPEVLEEFVKTKGESLRQGLETLLHDMETGQGMKMTDPSAFELGKSVALTKGEVVFRNHLFELIHYTPLTKEQHAVPLLIIPPWINKYYIFDLSASNSFVKWLVEQGHNVFIISWVNPGSEHASMTFEDYLLDGAYRACEVIASLTKSPSLNTMGYCVGGNLLTALNAYLAKVPAPFTLQTMTLLATVVDFEKMGDLRVFVDEDYLQHVEQTMSQNGFLKGEALKSLFSLLRPNDLVWSFFIKNYFLGQVPPAFDFLYWNSDSTRLPEGLHGFVLRKFFQENLFMKPGGISIKGIPLDLKEIMTPAFLLSTSEDHISPWQSSYPAVHLFKGPVEFVLAGSGHVAGVVNPPSKHKYGFFTNTSFPDQAHEWFESCTKNEGSWWTAWDVWVSSFGGEKVPSLATYPFLEAAPGSYVRMT
ncbi:MAG: class I poly(R)-hydroxyalkanoic acid synthase [Alphaproteobacteria bacterium]|nr:class I poly(R)-hydroxyalkanoic acid synthase [Alphaproteobacteria bacterium]